MFYNELQTNLFTFILEGNIVFIFFNYQPVLASKDNPGFEGIEKRNWKQRDY